MPEPLSALVDWWVAAAPRVVGPAYPWVSAGHILSLGLLVGSIATLDLRLLGLFRNVPLAPLARPLTRVAGTGLVLALLTGFLLFSVQPLHYLPNPAFQAKIALVSIGLVNVALVRRCHGWREALAGAPASARLRVAAGVSLATWAGAVFAGRWIAFL